MNIISDLEKIVGKHVLHEKEDLIPYRKDASYFIGPFPLAVVIPKTTGEVSKIMQLCYKNNIGVVVRGGGTALTGSSIPVNGSIILSMSRFDSILEAKIEDRYILAEPGVRLDKLNSYLVKFGHFYPPDPGSSIAATVGGSIATNAGGLRAATYGATKEWVLGLEVVLPTGKVVQTGGKVLKRTLGYDLTALMVGSEGTLGIITKAILKIAPLPDKVGRIMLYYNAIENEGQAISDLKRHGITPLIAEFMDSISMDAITKTKGIKFPSNANYLLIVDIASTAESLKKKLKEAAEILKKSKPLEIKVTTNAAEMDAMYQARKGLYSSQLSQRASTREYIVIADIVVPASELPLTLKIMKEKLAHYKLRSALFGHIGDGNIHANIFADINNHEVMTRVKALMMDFGKAAIEHDGSVSSEHGIGIEKKELLIEEMRYKDSLENIELMKAIKKQFDPKDLLNRGKIFD